jgi:hypothetical protein
VQQVISVALISSAGGRRRRGTLLRSDFEAAMEPEEDGYIVASGGRSAVLAAVPGAWDVLCWGKGP